MTDAWKKTIRDVIIILLIGFVYYLIYRFTGWGIPCAFREITGLRCPSCGISHMIIDLLHLDFAGAYKENQFLFFTWPLVVCEIIYMLYRHESGRDIPRGNVILISIFAVLLCTFGVLRIIFSW